jgi:hypothetical protein
MLRISLIAVGLFLASISCASGRAEPSSKPELKIHKVDSPDLIEVTLTPASDGSTRIWRRGSSWGAANWRVFIIRNNELFAFREDPDQRFSRNSPIFEELRGPKHDSLNLNSKMWIGPRDNFGTFRSGDKVIAVYEVPVTMEARAYGVWYGTVSAMFIVD